MRKAAVHTGVRRCLHSATCGSIWLFHRAVGFFNYCADRLSDTIGGNFVGANMHRFLVLKMILVHCIHCKVNFNSLKQGYKCMYVNGGI